MEKIMNRDNVAEEIYDFALELIKKRSLESGRMGIEDDKTNTNLISKHYSPMIVRKYNIINGWPLYVGLICDWSLSDLDKVVNEAIKACSDKGMIGNDIQGIRNVTGILSESIVSYYNCKKENCVEGVAILLYVDKCAVENFYGDFMNHTSCRIEWAGIIDMLPHI
jgi:hypothetical protein